MTSVNEYPDADETTEQQRDDWLDGRGIHGRDAPILDTDSYSLDREYADTVPIPHRHLGLAREAISLLHTLLGAKAGTNAPFRGFSPELDEVVEEEVVYTVLRVRCLWHLKWSERPDLLDLAGRLPECVYGVTMGTVAWDDVADDIERLRSELDVAYTLANLDPYRRIFAGHFNGVRARVIFILEQTRERIREKLTSLTPPRPTLSRAPRSARTIWQETLEREMARHPLPLGLPRGPVITGNPFSVVFDSMRETEQTVPLANPVTASPEDSQATKPVGRPRREVKIDDLYKLRAVIFDETLADKRRTAAANGTRPPKESDIQVTCKELMARYNDEMKCDVPLWKNLDRSTVRAYCAYYGLPLPWSREPS